ncbi:hypothetical protein ANN_11837 [Periplaneta americana]|uniref:Uncharacterized protein n=1 Tax=Periplaneta americana TaxID=6978 RepID=A0ABQ8T662_PERAM|nr:hypothetical protein ANN_11837 [Periplaneta americana]
MSYARLIPFEDLSLVTILPIMHVRYLSDYAMNYLALERKRPMQISVEPSRKCPCNKKLDHLVESQVVPNFQNGPEVHSASYKIEYRSFPEDRGPMAGLCEGGNEPPGSLKATCILWRKPEIQTSLCEYEAVVVFALLSTPPPPGLYLPNTRRLYQPFNQPYNKATNSISRPKNRQAKDQPTKQPTSGPSNRLVDKATDQPTKQPTNRQSNRPTGKATYQSTKQPTNRQSNLPVDKATDQPAKQPTSRQSNRPTDKATYQSTNRKNIQPTKQPLKVDKLSNFLTNRQSNLKVDKKNICKFEKNLPMRQKSYINQSTNAMYLTNCLTKQLPVDKKCNRPTGKATYQSTKQPTNRQSNLPVDKATDQPTKQPTSRQSNRPVNKAPNQPTKQPSSRLRGENGILLQLFPIWCKILMKE